MMNIDIIYYMTKFLYAKDFISYFLTCKDLYNYNKESFFTSYCKDNYIISDVDTRYSSTWKGCALYYDSNYKTYEYEFSEEDRTLYINMLPTTDIYKNITNIYNKYFDNTPNNIAVYLQHSKDDNVKINNIITICKNEGEYSYHTLDLGKIEKTDKILIITGDIVVYNIHHIITSGKFLIVDKAYKKMFNNIITNMYKNAKSVKEDKDFQEISNNLRTQKVDDNYYDFIGSNKNYIKKMLPPMVDINLPDHNLFHVIENNL